MRGRKTFLFRRNRKWKWRIDHGYRQRSFFGICQLYIVTGNFFEIGRTDQKKDYTQSSDDELLAVCKEFESYFVEQMFKEMQKTVDVFSDGESNPNDTLVDFFKDNALQELASTSTEKQGLGLAQMLYEQMKRNYNL